MYSTETVLQGEVVGTGSHGSISERDIGRCFGGEQNSTHIIRQELVVDDLREREDGYTCHNMTVGGQDK